METVIKVCSESSSACYDIKIEKGILNNIGNHLKSLTSASRIAVVSDSNVAPLYMAQVTNSLNSAGFDTYTFYYPAGEPQKNLDTVKDILEFFCTSNLTRNDLAIALGGGVCGDLTGFASAIYLRGINFVQIPTSLLAQVDSSVGGKTGCDLPFGKNLCGAFHNPMAVFIDPNTLKTLPEKFYNDGLAEAIKAGAIKLPELFNLLYENKNPNISKVINYAIKMKATVVENDFTEKGERTLLNFGHTLGHAIEKYENYRGHSHGEAVSIGMALITKASEKAGLTEKGTYLKLVSCLEKYNLPTSTNIPLESLLPLCLNDKKTVNNSVKAVFISKIGSAFVKKMSWNDFFDLIKKGDA